MYMIYAYCTFYDFYFFVLAENFYDLSYIFPYLTI